MSKEFNLEKALKKVRIYDNGGKTADRYTAVFMDEPERPAGIFGALGMSEKPFHPQGVGMHCSAAPGKHLGKRITYEQLPEDCQKAVRQSITPPTTDVVLLPAAWASALVNGDRSGLSAHEANELDLWCINNPQYGGCLMCSEQSHIGRFNGLITDVLVYTFNLKRPN